MANGSVISFSAVERSCSQNCIQHKLIVLNIWVDLQHKLSHQSESSTHLKTGVIIGGKFHGQIRAQQYVWRPKGEDFNPKNAAAATRPTGGSVVM